VVSFALDFIFCTHEFRATVPGKVTKIMSINLCVYVVCFSVCVYSTSANFELRTFPCHRESFHQLELSSLENQCCNSIKDGAGNISPPPRSC